MKKLFLILSLISVITTVQAQSQLKTVRGKTKEGKSIVVRYYQGTFEDNIESVKYEVIDELQNNLKEQQNKVKNLQNQLQTAENTASQLRQQFNREKDDKEIQKRIQSLNDSIILFHGTIDSLNRQIDSLNNRINILFQNDTLRQKADSLNLKLQDNIKSLQSRILQLQSDSTQLKKRNTDLMVENKNLNGRFDSINENLPEPVDVNPPVNEGRDPVRSSSNIGVELRIGQVIYGLTVNDSWNHDTRFSKHIAVYYGWPNLTKSEKFSISIEAGVGASFFDMSANRSAYGLVLDGQSDIDNDIYQAQYTYSALNEHLSLTYFDVPIRICFGQPKRGQASVYAKIGLTPSILLHSNFFGEGTYTLKGYYEDLQITFEDISELGFVSDADCYNEGSKPDLSRFMLWGNVAVGAYVPFGKSPVQLNFGVKVDYPITSVGRAVDVKALPEGMGLLYKTNKVITPSAVIGILYTFK